MDNIVALLINLLITLGFISRDDARSYYERFSAMENLRFERTEDGRVAIYAGGDGAVIIVFG